MKKLKQYFQEINQKRIKLKMIASEIKNIKVKKKLIQKVSLTKEQTRKIDEIWEKNYGKKISKDWHRLYTSYTGEFNENYFPEIFFTVNLLEKLNSGKRRVYLADKILTTYFFKDIKDKGFSLVKNYVYNCNGFFYSEDGIINYERTLELISDLGEVIIKPTTDSNSGNNVKLLNLVNGRDEISKLDAKSILNQYKKNYVIQEKIKQHSSLDKLNSSSVNTIRINTYICDDKVYSTPISMRIGRNGSIVDNAHAGGIQIGIKENGTLRKYAFSEKGEKFERHPDSGIKFEGYVIPKINDIVELAKKYHYRVPHMGIISWDFTIDQSEVIRLIEVNITCPTLWFPQYVNGEAFFGENTEKMIRMLKNK